MEEIWEVEYGGVKVGVLGWEWVRLSGGGVMIDESGMRSVEVKKVG